MKKLMLLSVLILAPGLDGKSVAFPNQAAAAGVLREAPGARPEYEHASEHQINAHAEKNHGNEKKLRPAGPTNEVDVKRLKLVFLLMMSLGPYRAPGH